MSRAPDVAHVLTGEALVSNSTYQRHRANHLENRLQNALAELAHVSAQSDLNRSNPMLEERVSSLQNELLGANQAVARLEDEVRELRSALHKASEDVRNAQLELGVLKGSPQKVPDPTSEEVVKELQKELEGMREQLLLKDGAISEGNEKLSVLQMEIDQLRTSLANMGSRSKAPADGGQDLMQIAGVT